MSSIRNFVIGTCALVMCLFLPVACGRGGPDCSEKTPIQFGRVVITFKNKSGDNLYPRNNPSSLNIDSLYVFNAKGRGFFQERRQVISTGSFPVEYYAYVFQGPYESDTDADALTEEKCEDYFIHFNSNDIDTLKLCYRVVNGDCSLYYSTFKAYYQNQLVLQDQRGVDFFIEISKQVPASFFQLNLIKILNL